MPAPPSRARTTKATRTMVVSVRPKYSARPPQTPASLRSVRLQYSLRVASMLLPLLPGAVPAAGLSGAALRLGQAEPAVSHWSNERGTSGTASKPATPARLIAGRDHRWWCRGERSDVALVDVAPAPGRARLAGGGDGVVGLSVVRLGMLVGRGVRAGHPAARQAQPQCDPVVPAGQAACAGGRLRPDLADLIEVVATRGVAVACGGRCR